MNRTRPKQIVIRASEEEFAKIKKKVELSDLTQNEYLLKAILEKEILVQEGYKDLSLEVKRIGVNINQLTKAANQGKIIDYSDELEKIRKELKEIWQSSKLQTRKVK